MHRACILQKDKTNALQCTEHVYYRKTERIRYNAQSAYITDRQNEGVTIYKKKKKNGAYHRNRENDKTSVLLRQTM